MLPVDARDELKLPGHTSRFMDGRFPDYMRRLCDFRQMDFEATFDQMLTLLSFEPSKVYVSFYYRKQTKNQWARDDPAFMVVEAAFVAVSLAMNLTCHVWNKFTRSKLFLNLRLHGVFYLSFPHRIHLDSIRLIYSLSSSSNCSRNCHMKDYFWKRKSGKVFCINISQLFILIRRLMYPLFLSYLFPDCSFGLCSSISTSELLGIFMGGSLFCYIWLVPSGNCSRINMQVTNWHVLCLPPLSQSLHLDFNSPEIINQFHRNSFIQIFHNFSDNFVFNLLSAYASICIHPLLV